MDKTHKTSLSITDAGTLSPSEFRVNLAHCRIQWSKALDLDSQTSLFTIASHLATKITEAIDAGLKAGSDLPTLKRSVRNATKLGRLPLLGATSLNRVTEEFLHEAKDNHSYWCQRLVGEMRAASSGLSDARSIKGALRTLVESESIDPYLTGPDGYRRVAELFCQGRMLKAFQLMSAVCKAEDLDFKRLNWGAQFAGTTKQFAQLRSEIKADFPARKFTGLTGYTAFADSCCQGSMLKAFKLMSAVCKAEGLDFKRLNWGARFEGTTKQFAQLRSDVKAEFPAQRFIGLTGYTAFADSCCQGSMKKAFLLMSAVCKAEDLDFKRLNWGARFEGTTQEFAGLTTPRA